MRRNGPPGIQIVKRLLAEDRLDHPTYEAVLRHAELHSETALDALLQIGAMREAELLKVLAQIFKTRFVSTEKLARAKVAREVIRLVPQKVAEKLGVFPILYDAGSGILSVVAANIEDPELAKQVKIATDVRNVTVFVARPAAVHAAIAKHYAGEVQAFGDLLNEAPADEMGGFSDGGGETFSQDFFPDPTGIGGPRRRARLGRQKATTELPHLPRIDLPPMMEDVSGPPPVPQDVFSEVQQPPPVPAQAVVKAVPEQDIYCHPDYLETVKVLVSLLEKDHPASRGHSGRVAHLCEKLGRRLGLSNEQLKHLTLAAYLHDVGKGLEHLTPLFVAEHEPYHRAAKAVFRNPVEVFDTVELPEEVKLLIQSMYERYDGHGFPHGISGNDIALGARILSVVESYSDLVSNEKSPFGRALKPDEALDFLGRYASAIFDAQVLEQFRAVALGDNLRSSLLPGKSRVLLIDPAADQMTALELRFIDQGYSVELARSKAEAIASVDAGPYGVVISEVEFPDGSGFDLLAELSNALADVPWIFLTSRSDRATITKGFEAGAADFIVKPAAADVVVTKALQIMESATGNQTIATSGISGSLSQMALAEIVQIFALGRKSGKLRVDSKGKAGEVHFCNGDVFNAVLGNLTGEKAFYALLEWREGQFSVDPGFMPHERLIHASAESLLLEGMRLLDEAARR